MLFTLFSHFLVEINLHHDVCDLGAGLQRESQVHAEGVQLPVTVELYEVLWHAGLEGKCSATATKAVRRGVG